MLLETNGAGAFQASYVLAGGELVSQNKGGVTSYLLKDGQGSTRALFSGGTLVIAGGNQIYSYTLLVACRQQQLLLVLATCILDSNLINQQGCMTCGRGIIIRWMGGF